MRASSAHTLIEKFLLTVPTGVVTLFCSSIDFVILLIHCVVFLFIGVRDLWFLQGIAQTSLVSALASCRIPAPSFVHILCMTSVDNGDCVAINDVSIIPLTFVCHMVASPARECRFTTKQRIFYLKHSKVCIPYTLLHLLQRIRMLVFLGDVAIESVILWAQRLLITYLYRVMGVRTPLSLLPESSQGHRRCS